MALYKFYDDEDDVICISKINIFTAFELYACVIVFGPTFDVSYCSLITQTHFDKNLILFYP
jgi:hypothetical protein